MLQHEQGTPSGVICINQSVCPSVTFCLGIRQPTWPKSLKTFLQHLETEGITGTQCCNNGNRGQKRQGRRWLTMTSDGYETMALDIIVPFYPFQVRVMCSVVY